MQICKYAKPNQSEISPRLPYHVTYCFLNSHLVPDSRIWSPQTIRRMRKFEKPLQPKTFLAQVIQAAATGGVCRDVFLFLYLQLITAHL